MSGHIILKDMNNGLEGIKIRLYRDLDIKTQGKLV